MIRVPLLFVVVVLSLSSGWAWAKDSLPRTIPSRAAPFYNPSLQHSFYLPEFKPEIEVFEEDEEPPQTDEWPIPPARPAKKMVAVTVNCPAVQIKIWDGYYRLKCFDGKIWGISQIFLSLQDVRKIGEPDVSNDSTTFYFILRRPRQVEVAHK